MKKVLLLALIIPTALFGQKTNDLIIALQRDMANLQDQMKTLQKQQDDKLAAIQSMLQQAIDASSRSASGIAGLQRDVDNKLTEQQTKLVAPVATLGSKVDQLADEFRAVSTTVVDLRSKVAGLDGKLSDISNAIRILAAATPQPAAPQASTPQAPAAPPADTLWESARRDESGGKQELAIEEYASYVKNYPETSRAPEAQYKIGWIYYNSGSNYKDAAEAFEGVERFPENPKTPEALYYKAVSLMKMGGDHKTEAGRAFKKYLADYKNGEHATNAHANLKALGLEPKTSARRPR